MKITILEKQAGEEDEIIVKCDYLDDNMTKLINQFKTGKGKMSFYIFQYSSRVDSFPEL